MASGSQLRSLVRVLLQMYTHMQWLVKWELAFLACREGGMYAGNAILVYWPNIWWDKSSGGSLGHCSLRVKANHRHARKVQHHSCAYLHWFLDSISSISVYGDRFFFWNPVQSVSHLFALCLLLCWLCGLLRLVKLFKILRSVLVLILIIMVMIVSMFLKVIQV